MTDYRRYRVRGGTYFFTVNLLDRRSRLLIDKVELLRSSVRHVLDRRPFHIDAWVVLPDHMHCVWTLPEGDADFSTRLRLIKTAFSKGVGGGEKRSASRAARNERGVWQRRFWEHAIRNDADYAAHVDYVHFNPVKHGLVASAAEWPHSSFQRSVARGMYPADWSCPDLSLEVAGERWSRPRSHVGWVSEA